MQLSIILNDGSRTPMHQRAIPCHTDYNPQARFSSRRATWTELPTDQMRKPEFLTQLSHCSASYHMCQVGLLLTLQSFHFPPSHDPHPGHQYLSSGSQKLPAHWSFFWPKSVSESHLVVSDSLQPHGLEPTRLICPWDSSGKNTGVSGCSLLQGVFPTHGWNTGLPHCRRILYYLSHQGSFL